MAKKLKQIENGAEKVAHLANLTGFDGDQLKKDVNVIIELGDEASEARAPISEKKAFLKAERGYHMGGFNVCVQLMRKEVVEARDMWRTIKAFATAHGLDDPDMVDMAEAAS